MSRVPLPQLCEFQMQRITSADPTGRNKDWRELAPGETLVVADVKGPGCDERLDILGFLSTETADSRPNIVK